MSMELRLDDLSYTEYKQQGSYDLASLLGERLYNTEWDSEKFLAMFLINFWMQSLYFTFQSITLYHAKHFVFYRLYNFSPFRPLLTKSDDRFFKSPVSTIYTPLLLYILLQIC